ncbi:MAG: type II secretion system ATPase GspE [Candidatus Thiodiazotropha sp. (ex Lucinoma borealis)]|nr:type II secretion system ATPase GspE [Candidatus Thiodiazotropha sp. (ex Lucinoma borealis)]MCU7838340.1 type II secretion system ATPase GspE [Candidatus Thiodiazotropha sp. (ex Troendleina suluensis)]MCU7867491.1 type II secretion system ATPase GspE [Candidatus Thiodiazotropha sp. (ex Lucinoma borealis)]
MQHLDLTQTSSQTLQTGILAFLQENSLLSSQDHTRVEGFVRDTGEGEVETLIHLGLISEPDLIKALSELYGLHLVENTDEYPQEPVHPEAISLRFLKEMKAIPLAMDVNRLVVAVADPGQGFIADAIRLVTDMPVSLKIGRLSEIESALERVYGAGRSVMGEIVDGLDGEEEAEESIEHLKDLASEAPIIRLVNHILHRAVEVEASDIHIEPFEERLMVRYRIDGILTESESPPSHSTAAIISRIKIMAKLNIAEQRVPQDGRISVKIQGNELELRVSTVPTLYGESVVIRLLNKKSISFEFDSLGFGDISLARLQQSLQQPNGIILVTGPTGSGKSTTLYTALSQLNKPGVKIITVEDPVEYKLEGINQIQVKPQVGMDFANALRAIVRQDPDIIMVGEMRDAETVRIAVQAALTGHLVLSTLHTNDAAGTVSRLLDMGVEPYLLASTVNAIVAQRLARRLCSQCKQAYMADEVLAQRFRHAGLVAGREPVKLYQPIGCDACSDTGYSGRMNIAEVMLISEAVRQQVIQHAHSSTIQQLAVQEGMDTMYQDGLAKVLKGHTSFEELMRVSEEDE